jgi:hypothetical protein
VAKSRKIEDQTGGIKDTKLPFKSGRSTRIAGKNVSYID